MKKTDIEIFQKIMEKVIRNGNGEELIGIIRKSIKDEDDRKQKVLDFIKRVQEVSQPEKNLGWGDTELKFEKCDKNLLESIFGEDKRDEEDKKLDQRIIESHENNTEEWEKKFSNLLLHYLDDDLEEENLIEFIEQLLSERSFSKEELETIKQIIDTHDGHKVGCEALGDILEKADRLLSLEK